MYLDGVVLDEYAQMPPKVWSEVIRPMLSDRQGWAIFIGTPMGRNAFCELYEGAKHGFPTPPPDGPRLVDPDWYQSMYRASQTTHVPPDELASARRQMSEAQYAQEYECSFEAAIAGAYYGTLMAQAESEGRICNVPHDAIAKVETWWDLGIGDPTAIWFVQRIGRALHLIDYYEASGEPVSHYLGVLDDRRRERKYIYGKTIVPWDARKTEITSATSMDAMLKDAGYDVTVISAVRSPGIRIENARRLIPLSYFDRTKCARGIEALKQYRADWDDSRQAFANRPYHDWTSHPADAFGTGAMYQPSQPRKPVVYPANHVSKGFA